MPLPDPRAEALAGPPVLAVTGGDPNGIGPEVALRALLDPAVRRVCRPLLVGDPGTFSWYARRYRLPLTVTPVDNIPGTWARRIAPVVTVPVRAAFRPTPGRTSRAAGALAAASIERAVALWRAGEVAGIVTAPLSKESLNAAGHRYPGQTEMFARLTGTPRGLMIMLDDRFRIAIATIHLPLRRVPGAITTASLVATLRAFAASLRADFAIRRPSIAVLGLNPHAGENGLLGDEERTIITPAIRRARGPSAVVEGPFPADGFFGSGAPSRYDGILAMYHDQGLVPLKMAGFGAAVNFTAGLPVVRTSPGHGTAYDIAGKGVADPRSTVAAILAAAEIARRRAGATSGRRHGRTGGRR